MLQSQAVTGPAGSGRRVAAASVWVVSWVLAASALGMAAFGGGDPDALTTYGALKAAVTDAVVSVLEPVQARYADLAADPVHVEQVYARGAQRCREVTRPLLEQAARAIGVSVG